MIAILPSDTGLSSDVAIISHQKIDKRTFGVVSIGHKKS